ncbi:surface protein P113 isoform X1 [Hydra vulgaris]|uniref:surface protein P113 isoform X1 n=1 Tax=Hydra vulgaris TaxID=6087 RepID=UPI001F5E746B|nr:surface protein P113 isoform X1 [Hydra vulgaris]XP_047134361.1 surface protein P113 isoform X1 [Hydra vulgaris]
MSAFDEINTHFLTESDQHVLFLKKGELSSIVADDGEQNSCQPFMCDDYKKDFHQNCDKVELFGTILNKNKTILMDHLKASVVLLNISTEKIENDVDELACTIKNYHTEKKFKQDDTSTLDVELFQSINTDEEICRINYAFSCKKENIENKNHFEKIDYDENYNNDNNNNNTSSYLPLLKKCYFSSEDFSEQTDQQIIMDVIKNLECKIKNLDERIVSIDNQHARILELSNEIKQNEQLIEDIHKVFDYNCYKDNEKEHNIVPMNVEDSHKRLEHQVQTFMEKIDLNTKRIESAWVGLIAALLLIPIAYFLGKFL